MPFNYQPLLTLSTKRVGTIRTEIWYPLPDNNALIKRARVVRAVSEDVAETALDTCFLTLTSKVKKNFEEGLKRATLLISKKMKHLNRNTEQ
ncbi:hypothetical protein DLC15_10670 [Salmonella enterica subsp. enterica serovar Telelkebir]|nr:hypothetical protein [Salmonella enterica]EBU8553026.1 hypothetical protein [Salmonella enterica subsp. enterica serovar Telelkebir]ECA9844099.1 hypothetical protein [Salmonella enterica subsp. enterica serovar Essen]ECB1174590.1 hypothetical protein [Salmonella enterica subsp. enterica serovar Essen]